MASAAVHFIVVDLLFIVAPIVCRAQGGGGTLILSSYVGSGPVPTVHPKKYQEFQAPQKHI